MAPHGGIRCPVCGVALWFEPWRGDSAADEICPCCGIQFGYDDAVGGRTEARPEAYREWRRRWIAAGMPWLGAEQQPPPGWDPREQLKRIGVTV